MCNVKREMLLELKINISKEKIPSSLWLKNQLSGTGMISYVVVTLAKESQTPVDGPWPK